MSELEKLRKEVNELRERIVKLENRPAPIDLTRFGGRQAPHSSSDDWKFRPQNNVWLAGDPLPQGAITNSISIPND